MQKWDYKIVVKADHFSAEIRQEGIQKEGEKGWELVSHAYIAKLSAHEYTFKRLLPKSEGEVDA